MLPRGNGSTVPRRGPSDALLVLSKLVWKRPPSEFDAPRTTVEVLDDLGHAIGAQDRRIALACLRELEASADLDQSNLAFLRLRVYAGLQNWDAILEDQDLPHILAMRRPIGVTRIIQRAVYAEHLAAADVEGRDQDLLAAMTELPQSFMALATAAVTKRRSDVVVEFLLAMSSVDGSATVTRLLAEAEQIEAGLADRLSLLLPVADETVELAEPEPTPVPAPEPSSVPEPETEPTPPDPLDEATRLAAAGSLRQPSTSPSPSHRVALRPTCCSSAPGAWNRHDVDGYDHRLRRRAPPT